MDATIARKVSEFSADHPGPYKLYPRAGGGTLVFNDAADLMDGIAELSEAGWSGKAVASDSKSISLTIKATGTAQPSGREVVETTAIKALTAQNKELHTTMLGLYRLAGAQLERTQTALESSHSTIMALSIQVAVSDAEQRGGLAAVLTDPAAAGTVKELIGALSGGKAGAGSTLKGLKADMEFLSKNASPEDMTKLRAEVLGQLIPGLTPEKMAMLIAFLANMDG